MNVATRRASVLFAGARSIYKHEGLIPLLRKGFTFLANHLFWHRTYDIYERTIENIENLNEADFLPKIDGFTSKIISTNEEANKLEADGFDFSLWPLGYRDALDKGAVAFCIFVGRELANICWVYLTDEAKESMGHPPYKVDFSNGEACPGGMTTNPKYRGMGLATYCHVKRCQFLREKGKIVSRTVADTNNVVSRRIAAKFGLKLCAEGRHLRILWWQSWKEKPLDLQ